MLILLIRTQFLVGTTSRGPSAKRSNTIVISFFLQDTAVIIHRILAEIVFVETFPRCKRTILTFSLLILHRFTSYYITILFVLLEFSKMELPRNIVIA